MKDLKNAEEGRVNLWPLNYDASRASRSAMISTSSSS